MITITINKMPVEVKPGISVLEAAKAHQVKIPTLCAHPDVAKTAACGLCIVKIKGMRRPVRACVTNVDEGMEITTNDSELYATRKTILELILSSHPDDCLHCQRNNDCELQRLASEFGVRKQAFDKIVKEIPQDCSTPSLILDPSKCVLCGRCVNVCQADQNVWALEFIGRGFETKIAPAANVLLNDSPCVKCGQCSAHCPVGAIVEHDFVDDVMKKLQDPEVFSTVQMAPAVRVAFAEGFNGKSGDIVTKQMYTLFRRLGFNAVFDTNFAADLTIMEEATEFVERFTKQPGSLPLVTSCCPAWVDYMEKFFPDMISHFSTAKSPHQMLGVMTKTYYAEKQGIDARKMYNVSVMPCTAKKYEVSRVDEMFSSGHQDVDVVLTTRELVRMAKTAGIEFNDLPDEEADSILGEYSGAGTIFAATGGVMEAAIRTAYHLVTGDELEKVEVADVRGLEGVKEAEIDIKGTKLRVAVAHGLKNVESVLNRVKEAKIAGADIPWHFIEVMACRGGCVAGGGQPYGVTDSIREKRSVGVYKDDVQQKIRCSHMNPEIIRLYDEFLDAPNSEKAHKYLHTHYKSRSLYN